MDVDIKVKPVTTQSELDEAFHIRTEVFVKEQGVALEVEMDEYDESCDHILVYCNGQSVGTGRLRDVEGVAKLERICILPTHRQYGLGRTIVQALEKIAKDKGFVKAKLHGQTHAERFYEKVGYTKASEVFMEEGIPHVLMLKDLSY